MSRILDKLKEAEAQREQVVAERRRLEAAADAALAAHDREATAGRARQQAPVQPRPEAAGRQRAATPPSRAGRAWIAIGAVLLSCLAVGVLYFAPEPVQAPARAQEPAPAPRAVYELKLDRNLDAFAQRLRAKDKP